VVVASCLKKLLEVIHRQPRLVLKITLVSGNELLVGVTDVLANIIFTTTSGDHNLLGPPSWPLLITFDAPLCSLVGGCS
jgi:hypothetical protein